VAEEARVEVIEIAANITRVVLHYRFMQYPTIYEGLKLACRQGKLPGVDLSDIIIMSAARPSSRARTSRAGGSGGSPCLPSCSATPSARPRSSACRPDSWSSSAPSWRSRCLMTTLTTEPPACPRESAGAFCGAAAGLC
jgi:hypothetical protein